MRELETVVIDAASAAQSGFGAILFGTAGVGNGSRAAIWLTFRLRYGAAGRAPTRPVSVRDLVFPWLEEAAAGPAGGGIASGLLALVTCFSVAPRLSFRRLFDSLDY